VDAAAVSALRPPAAALLLEHCFALDELDEPGPSAAVRLEALLGRELARRLVFALSPSR